MPQIFISYRHIGGEFLGKMLYDRLSAMGYQVIFDVETMRSGKFNKQLYQVIDDCDDIILLLSPGALDRCTQNQEGQEDWVREEISYALKRQKNIVPIILRGFEWPSNLPSDLEELPLYEAIEANSEYFDRWLDRLTKNLLKSSLPDDKSKNTKPTRTDSNPENSDNILLTKKTFAKFINSITYRTWTKALREADRINSSEHFGGIFFLYSKLIDITQIQDEDSKDFEDGLLISKALYNIALEDHFYSLCDFMTEITNEMVMTASKNIQKFMVDHINVFGNQGLVEICFQKLMISEEKNNIDREFWERCIKDIFELYRMIPD